MKKIARVLWSELLPHSPIFTTSEIAVLAGLTPSNASRDLAELEREGVVTRVRRGTWAVTSHPDFSPFAVVPHLFRKGQEGYVSLLSALNLHAMIEQIPRTIQVMTTRQRPRLVTPVGIFDFHKLHPQLYGGFEAYGQLQSFELATPEKAIFDILYLSVRRARRFSALPELTLPDGFASAEVERWISRLHHAPVRSAVARRWEELMGIQSVASG